MDFADDECQAFLSELRQLNFHEVAKILKRNEDLTALMDQDGVRITSECPSLGAAFHDLKAEPRQGETKLEYRYFCGFADDIFFGKPTQSDRRIRFFPLITGQEYLRGLPELGDYLMGETEPSPYPFQGKRFAWWTRLHKQDYRFVQVILGQTHYSAEKLESKLTLEYQGCRDRRLFLLVKALHFRDVAFFVDLAGRGEIVKWGEHASSISMWLRHQVAPMLPDFWQQFVAETRGGRES